MLWGNYIGLLPDNSGQVWSRLWAVPIRQRHKKCPKIFGLCIHSEWQQSTWLSLEGAPNEYIKGSNHYPDKRSTALTFINKYSKIIVPAATSKCSALAQKSSVKKTDKTKKSYDSNCFNAIVRRGTLPTFVLRKMGKCVHFQLNKWSLREITQEVAQVSGEEDIHPTACSSGGDCSSSSCSE